MVSSTEDGLTGKLTGTISWCRRPSAYRSARASSKMNNDPWQDTSTTGNTSLLSGSVLAAVRARRHTEQHQRLHGDRGHPARGAGIGTGMPRAPGTVRAGGIAAPSARLGPPGAPATGHALSSARADGDWAAVLPTARSVWLPPGHRQDQRVPPDLRPVHPGGCPRAA